MPIPFSGCSSSLNIISVKQGNLTGTTMISRNGTIFNAYLGIPFATPPLGNLRFKPPIKAKSWQGVLNATQPGACCIQISEETRQLAGSEDCLNLNIYTPQDAQPGDNIPVIVYIFGGLFKQNSNLDNGPEYMMDKRIIIVMPNHRLGALGFLSTGDAVISGNMGLKDQVLALQWVKDNIDSFGGNPNQITLHGHSSGAICVHLHTLSPVSAGLFNRVIIQSGVGDSVVGFFDKEVSRAVGVEFAHKIGCKHKSSKKILQCLLKQDANAFPFIQEQMFIWSIYPLAPFRPTVEIKDAERAFLTQIPPKAQHPLSNYEWLIGTTTGEGAYNAAGLLTGDGKLARQFDEQYKELFPITLMYLWTTNLKYIDQISTSIRKHYFGDERIDNTTAKPLMHMFTDDMFAYPTNRAIRKFEGTRYVYLYDYWSNYSTQNAQGYYPRIGISHAEELNLIYKRKASVPFLADRDIDFGNELITRWINFAYSG
ncbi:hypothetical protein V9T40_011610 [Parthenolecanium corni]|uniref:Carboxylic ester hydrolase n=1 Tax=Parthenolecanium corni TaxID=536013 RepID=A0AAN9T985_9HEMI